MKTTFENKEGGIAVKVDGVLVGWIVRSNGGFKYENSAVLFDAITTKLAQLNGDHTEENK